MSDSSDFFPALQNALIRHLRIHALRTDGPFTLSSGEQSDWYLDGRLTTYSGEGAVLVGRCILEVLAPTVTAVGGMTMGADPVAVATAVLAALDERPLDAFSVRKQAKGHGAGGRLVGPVGPDDRVAVIDDTVTTGTSMFEAIDVLRTGGIAVVQAIAIVDRSDGVVQDKAEGQDLRYNALVTPADLGVL